MTTKTTDCPECKPIAKSGYLGADEYMRAFDRLDERTDLTPEQNKQARDWLHQQMLNNPLLTIDTADNLPGGTQ